MTQIHSIHIPVMGSAFTIDTPVKVAKYGISSVISLVDDTLIEEMRQYYCEQVGRDYTPITKYEEDYRAKRITAYLNLVDIIVQDDFEKVKSTEFKEGSEIVKYFENLSDTSTLKTEYVTMKATLDPVKNEEMQKRLRDQMKPGDINVNIMTKLDRTNYSNKDKTELSMEYSDALSALRGYAKSSLNSGIVFSAGINRRLYSHMEKFKDFYADAKGFIKKKIIIKVSDYRSSIIQGKFIAKKGLWVSEYRIESGLNCGGHAFASDGFLMGPILEEFLKKKDELVLNLHNIYNKALELKNKMSFSKPHEVKITAQGGIGTNKENNFLIDFFKLDGTGWATPFLLVPEATNIDEKTLERLANATEDDLYLSDVSPLGVPFNNLRGSLSDDEKERKTAGGKPGSACPKGHLVSNTEFTEKPICVASRQYQKLKVEQLGKLNLAAQAFKEKYDQIVKKACICHDLGEAVLMKYNIENKRVKHFSAVCPGPNLAYFSKVVSLSEMISHIYGRVNLLNNVPRPNMFIKELKMYVEYLMKEVGKASTTPTEKQVKYFDEFRSNILDGIEYYKDLFPKMIEETQEYQRKALNDLHVFKKMLEDFVENNTIFFSQLKSELIPA